MNFNLRGVSKGTWIRVALFVLATANGALELVGKSPLPISNETLSEFVSYLFLAITSVIGFWKNNSFTNTAQKADRYMGGFKQ